MDPFTVLGFLKCALKHWKLVGVVALVLAVVVLLAWNRVLRRDCASWELRAEVAREQSANAIKQAQKAEEGRRRLKQAIEEYMERAKRREQRLNEMRRRIAIISEEARKRMQRAEQEARLRVKELEARLGGLDKCQQCQEALVWLDEEIGW